jgi:hypothetical protein
MIKIKNIRDAGSLFHYAHFICDCLFPEIVNDIFNYKKVFRKKNIDQTLGNFKDIYEEVMNNESIEIPEQEFNMMPGEPTILNPKGSYCDTVNINKFRDFIFARFSINPLVYDLNSQDIVLIKRGGRKELINDPDLLKINTNVRTGKERREINGIENIESALRAKYNERFISVFLEEQSFREQIKLFNNAKLIIMAHGAGMSNMFFCKSGTTLLEVTCNTDFHFFNVIAQKLGLNHIKIRRNDPNIILGHIENITKVDS